MADYERTVHRMQHDAVVARSTIESLNNEKQTMNQELGLLLGFWDLLFLCFKNLFVPTKKRRQ
jgi:hypothetical protein